MERNIKNRMFGQKKPRWPGAPPDLERSPMTRSNSSASGDSLSKLVRRVSRSWGGKANGIFRKSASGTTDGSSESRDSSTLDRPQLGPDGIYSPSGGSDTGLENSLQDQPSMPPAVLQREPHGSVQFSGFPSRNATLGSRSIGAVFNICRRRLSINSLADHHGGTGGTGRAVSSASTTQTSADPPRLGSIHHLDQDTAKDSFQADLQEAMKTIATKGEAPDYVEHAKPRALHRMSASLPVRGRASAFNRVALGEFVTPQPCRRPAVQNLFNSTDYLHLGRLNKNSGVRQRAGPDSEEDQSQDTVLKQVQRELTKLSPATAMIANQLQPASFETYVADTPLKLMQETVKLVYPWIQQTEGRVEVFPTHETAMVYVSLNYETDPIHDLAFYDKDMNTYLLQPTCFLVDSENEVLAKSRGMELVSLTRKTEVMELAGTSALKMVSALRVYGPSVSMVVDDDYIMISIRRDKDDSHPVIVEDTLEASGDLPVVPTDG